MGKKKTEFWQSLKVNQQAYQYYYNRLMELALSRFNWTGLPSTCDERFMELALNAGSGALFVMDETLGGLLSLRFMPGAPFDMYGNAVNRIGWGYNETRVYCTDEDSVIVYNNYLKRPNMRDLEYFAHKLYSLDRTIDVNIRAQKTPVLIICDENEVLTMQNLYKDYDGNAAVIFGKKSFNPDNVQSISTGAPFVAPDMNELKNKVWNEALTYLGIYNVELRSGTVTVEEVRRSQGGTLASRFGALSMRQKACDEVRRKFGIDIWCEYRNPDEYADLLMLEDVDRARSHRALYAESGVSTVGTGTED